MYKRNKRQNKKIKWLITFLVVILLLSVRLVEEIGQDKHPDERFVVARVIDGDTVELKGGDRLRLLSVDTPEKGEPFYEEARTLLASKSLGEVAKIDFANKRRDRYGRLLGYLYINDELINKTIISNGLGYLYLFKDTEIKHPAVKEMLEAQKEAIFAQTGIWSLKRYEEDYYINKSGSFRLHRPSCSSVRMLKEGKYRKFKKREDGFITGLSPCRNCKP